MTEFSPNRWRITEIKNKYSIVRIFLSSNAPGTISSDKTDFFVKVGAHEGTIPCDKSLQLLNGRV